MDENREKFRKWLDAAKKTRLDSPFLQKSTDQYLKDEIRKGADGKYWIYIGSETAKECMTSSRPNVWFRLNDEKTITIGLNFNSNKAVEKAENILRGYSKGIKEQLFRYLQSNNGWNATISMRKKLHNFAEASTYERLSEIPLDNLREVNFNEVFKPAKEKINEYREREKLPKDNPEHLVRGGGVAFNLLYKEIPAEEKFFSDSFAYVHDALIICLKIQTPAEQKKEENKKYVAWECTKKNCRRKYDPKKYENKYARRVCLVEEHIGADLKEIKIGKEEWERTFGYSPE